MDAGGLGDFLLALLHHLELLRGQFAARIDTESAGRLAVGVEDDVGVRAGHFASGLAVVEHGVGVCHHAPAVQAPQHLGLAGVDLVLWGNHGPDQAVWHVGQILPVAEERHVGELVVLVRAGHVIEKVRAGVPSESHLLECGLLDLGESGDDGLVVARVVEIRLHGRAVGQRHDVAAHPLAVPDFVQADAHALDVAPIDGGNARVALDLPRLHQARVLLQQRVKACPATGGHSEQRGVLRHQRNGVLQFKPAAAHQIAGIGQVRLLGPPVPKDFTAMHVLDAVRALERVMLAGHFHPAKPRLALGGVGVGHGAVGAGFDLGMLELERQRLGQFVVAFLVVLGAHAPIGARLGLHA